MTSIRLALLRRVHRFINYVAEYIAEYLSRYEAHSKPVFDMNLRLVGAINNDAATRQVNNAVVVPVLGQYLNEQCVGTLVNNVELGVAQLKNFSHNPYTPEMLEKMRQWNTHGAGSNLIEAYAQSQRGRK